MPTISVCQKCKTICAKCHSPTSPSHPVWVCVDCARRFNGKCCCCGGRMSGSGPGRVCNKCNKSNTCTFCGKKL